MLIELTQRFPNFFSGFSPEKYQLSSIDDFNNAKFIKQWAENPKFVRFSIDRCHRPQAIIVVELNDNSYWAIAFIKNLQDNSLGFSELNLQQWKK